MQRNTTDFVYWFYILLCCCCCVTSVMSDSVWPHRRQPTRIPVPGILQARILEWVAISFSNAWKWKVKVKSLSHVWLLVTPWTAAYQAPLCMGFSRQEYWSGVPLPSPLYPDTLLNLLISAVFKMESLVYTCSPSWTLWQIHVDVWQNQNNIVK